MPLLSAVGIAGIHAGEDVKERDDMVEVVRHLAAGCLPPISISFECATAAA